MLAIKADLYIPISWQVLSRVIDSSADQLEAIISSLDVPQIASLLLLQSLPRVKNKPPACLEKQLAETIDNLISLMKKDELYSVKVELVSLLNLKEVKEGYGLLSSLNMALLDEKAAKSKGYLSFDDSWDYAFNERHNNRFDSSLVRIDNNKVLTPEQSRLYREIWSQIDDHVHIQGYAGTGKSFLIKGLISMLSRKGVKVLILADRKSQIRALGASAGQLDHVDIKTFKELAEEIIPQDLTDKKNRNMRQRRGLYKIEDKDVIKRFNIIPGEEFKGPRREENMLRAVYSVVKRYCYSEDDEVHLGHTFDRYTSSLSVVTRHALVKYAQAIWDDTILPALSDFSMPVWGYHKVKWVALNKWQIPSGYTHVLVDECHNLAKSQLQIFDASPQAVISLGDKFQNLKGRSQQRSEDVRNRKIACSVRSGSLLEDLVNPIIANHSREDTAIFQGNRLNSFSITYYNKPRMPEKPAAIVVDDMWGVFEWAQRIAHKGLYVNLLTNKDDLDRFVTDCIDFFYGYAQPRHMELLGFSSWDKLVERYHKNQSFQKVHRMLCNNYSQKIWRENSDKFFRDIPQAYSLGRVEDIRNHEFDSVMLLPDMINRAWFANSENKAARYSSVYVAITRARRQLILPENLRSWIEELSARPSFS